MSRNVIDRPFTGSLVTDVPPHLLNERDKPFAQDGFSPQGVFRQRQGWAFNGTTAAVADNLASVHRSQYILADVTRTVVVDDDGDAFVHNPSGAGTAIFTGDVQYLPRAVYRDELILCAQDGLSAMRRYSGSVITREGEVASPTWTANEATVTGMTFSAAPTAGSYLVTGTASGREQWFRVLEGSTTSVTVEDVLSTSTQGISVVEAVSYGYSYPCVVVHNAGSASVAVGGTAVTGYGTKWSTGGFDIAETDREGTDSVLMQNTAGLFEWATILSVGGDTSLSVLTFGDSISKRAYQILRRCPFKDAAAHQGSLWGTGVAQYPSRVYVSPPGWNPSLAPGAIPPNDPSTAQTSSNVNEFLLDFIDVPSSFDGDDNVAILPSPGPLLVLKRNAVYGIAGSYPSFSTDLLADGIGCIDIRSAQSFDEGQFFAGENGIYWYRGGQFIDLTAGKINREWRELTRQFDYGVADYCTLWIASGHLFVHITTAGGTIQRTYLCDLRDQSWQSRVTNITPRYGFTSRIPGEPEKALVVQDADQGRVIDTAPTVNGSGSAKDGDGTAPRLQAWTPENLDGRSMDEDTRMLDLAVHANVYDAGAAGSTSMAVSVVSQDALTHGATGTKTLSDIDSDQVDRTDRHYFRRVDRRGRRHQVRLDVDTLGTDSNATKVEVAQVVATFRDTRSRT